MMKIKILLLNLFTVISPLAFTQGNALERINFILGTWEGEGSGFGNERSRISSSFQLVMDDNYIEVVNESKFDPTENNPEGEIHIDKGFISFDKDRKVIVFRQFNIEGYINTYLLVESLSNSDTLVFETEAIENFVPGGKARWTINKLDNDHIVTVFDVLFPDQGYTCFGTNRLSRRD